MELELRAWIPKNDTPGYGAWQRIEETPTGILFYQDDQYLGSFLRRANNMDSGREHDSYQSTDFLLERYTGVTDSNKRKIFEGDIAETDCNDVATKRGIITYSTVTASWGIKRGSFFQALGPLLINHWKVTVIGNIHDGQGLLDA